MGMFGSVRQMFDGRPGSPVEDWLRQQGIVGAARAPMGDVPQGMSGMTPGFGDGVGGGGPAVNVGPPRAPAAALPGGSMERGLWGRGRRPAAAGPFAAEPVLGPSTAQFPTDMAGGPYFNQAEQVRSVLADSAMRPSPKKQGFNWGDAAIAFFGGPQAMKIRADRQERTTKEEERQRIGAIQAQAYDHLVFDRGVHPAQARMMVQNPQKLAEEWSTSQRTREVSEGETVMGPTGSFTAPKSFEIGSNVYRYDPQAGGSQMIVQGQTEAERYAQTLGIPPGSPAFNAAVQDFTLRANGPTAFGQNRALQDARLGQSDINNRRSVGASIENNIRTTSTSRENRENTPVGTVLNERGEVVVAYPNNRTTTLRNSRPVAGGRRAGRAAGGGITDGTVIRNPQTGQTMVRRGGQWVAQR